MECEGSRQLLVALPTKRTTWAQRPDSCPAAPRLAARAAGTNAPDPRRAPETLQFFQRQGHSAQHRVPGPAPRSRRDRRRAGGAPQNGDVLPRRAGPERLPADVRQQRSVQPQLRAHSWRRRRRPGQPLPSCTLRSATSLPAPVVLRTKRDRSVASVSTWRIRDEARDAYSQGFAVPLGEDSGTTKSHGDPLAFLGSPEEIEVRAWRSNREWKLSDSLGCKWSLD